MGSIAVGRDTFRTAYPITSRTSRAGWILGAMAVGLALLIVFSIVFGRYPIPLSAWLDLLLGRTRSGDAALVLLEIRLPRILACLLIGGGLSVSGATYQGLFRNPMVSPDILGASAGAGFGAALGILLARGIVEIQLLSFLFSVGAVGMVWLLSTRVRGRDPVLMLVLIGILVGSVFTALLSLLKYISDPNSKLPEITFWLMGSLAAINPKDIWFISAPILAGLIPLLLLRWRLNILSFGEEEARALGVNTGRQRLIIIVCSTLITAASVSVAGMIGWVGLVVPHLGRLLVGPNHRVLLPASLLLGSGYLLLVDDVARGAHTTEIPLGILTSLVGAPFFLYFLLRRARGEV